MDRLRVKHVITELSADFNKQAKWSAIPNDFAFLVRRFCQQVACLLIWGSEAYRRLELEPAGNYHQMRRPADLVYHAVLRAAYSWNWDMEGRVNPVKIFLDPFSLAMYMADSMKDNEVYFQEHPEKVLAYDLRYTSIYQLLDAPVDVEAFGEPYEMAPLPLSNGRIGCHICNMTVKDMDVLATHHEALHQNHGRVACTECTWTSADASGVLADHQQTAHEIYPAGHPLFFSTDAGHLLAKSREELAQLLVEDSTTRCRLTNQPDPTDAVPWQWSYIQIALCLVTIRAQIKCIPGWQRAVAQARVGRIAQQ